MDQTEMLWKHDDDLYRGNGKPGLTTRVAVCEERIEDVKNDVKDIAKNQVWATRFTIATLVGLAVEIIVLIVHH